MPADTESSIAPATRSGRPRVWYRRCLPTTVTRLPTPSRRRPLAAGSTRLERKRRRRRPASSSQPWYAYPHPAGRRTEITAEPGIPAAYSRGHDRDPASRGGTPPDQAGHRHSARPADAARQGDRTGRARRDRLAGGPGPSNHDAERGRGSRRPVTRPAGLADEQFP